MRRKLATWLALATLACGGESTTVPNEGAGSGTGGTGGSVTSGGASGVGAAGGTTGGNGSAAGSSVSGASGTFTVEPPPGGTGGSGGEPAPHVGVACGNPRPRETGGGYIECEDGSYRRTATGECVSHLPYVPDSDTKVGDECLVDTDCPSEHDYCKWGLCQHGCIHDGECSQGQICFCEEPVGRCVAALCTSNKDCPADFPCSGTFGFAWSGFACQSPDDECFQDSDCGSSRYSQCVMETPRKCVVVPG